MLCSNIVCIYGLNWLKGCAWIVLWYLLYIWFAIDVSTYQILPLHVSSDNAPLTLWSIGIKAAGNCRLFQYSPIPLCTSFYAPLFCNNVFCLSEACCVTWHPGARKRMNLIRWLQITWRDTGLLWWDLLISNVNAKNSFRMYAYEVWEHTGGDICRVVMVIYDYSLGSQHSTKRH